jgi:transposase
MQKKDTLLDFSKQTFFLGLDVHKKNWSVTVRANSLELRTFSMNPDPGELSRYMQRHYPNGTYLSCYESGFSGYWIHRELGSLGIKNIVVNPADIPTTNKEQTMKMDPVDSRKMARELEGGTLRAIYIPDELSQELRSLSRMRLQLVKDETRIKNRIKGFLHFYGKKIPESHEMKHWSRRFIEELRKLEFTYPLGKEELQMYIEELQKVRESLLGVVKQLRKYIREYGKEEDMELLMSIPGIGYKTALAVLTEIMDIKRFPSFDKLACFIGFVPSTHSSGEKDRVGPLSLRYSRYLRSLLIEASWIAVRRDPALTLSFMELTKRMSKQEAIVRIAKKLLSRLFHVWKNRVKYSCAVVK